jgi:hypothetical protein
MANIYKLTADYSRLQQLIEDGQIDETQAADTFDAIQEDLNTKAVNSGYVIKNIEADIEARANAIKELSERNKKAKQAILAIKQRVQFAMETTEVKKIDDPIMPVRIQSNPAAVNVIDEKNIPAFYFKSTVSLDKTKLKADLKAGKPVTGAELIKGSSVRWG